MKAEDIYRALILHALEPILRRVVHPETTYNDQAQYEPRGWARAPGADIRDKDLVKPGYKEKYGKKPLPPRERLAARLTILLILKELQVTLMKEIKEDTEAIDDARAFKQELSL